MMDVMEATRVDRWLWAVRLTKTRPDAAAACRGGHVRINDRPAKPATEARMTDHRNSAPRIRRLNTTADITPGAR